MRLAIWLVAWMLVCPSAIAETFGNRATVLAAVEMCAISADDHDQALAFADMHDFVVIQRRQDGATLFGSPDGGSVPWLALTVRAEEGGEIRTCDFELEAVGEIPRGELAALADRLGYGFHKSDGSMGMMRETATMRSVAFMGVTPALPCPGEGNVEVAESIRAQYLRVCGRPGFRFQMMGVRSVSGLPQ